ncbi:MAG: LysM peptidoglycan-binding domain-containing protein [Anaerolineales bacterium]|nr:LysM peptidoglycan-binding domain-containing protein [Anaerolineales bacterium]
MKFLSHSLTLLILSSLLTACNLFGGNAATPEIQATPANLVELGLNVDYDKNQTYNTAGQVIPFKYIVTMFRNDTESGASADVAISGANASCPPLNTIGNLDDRFDSGETLECNGDYVITQEDIQSGSVTNIVAASAYSVSSNSVVAEVPTVSPRALTLTKTASPSAYGFASQQIAFTYVVTNSGSEALGPAQFMIIDSGINANQPFNCGAADSTLAPGATLTCNATYSVTAADADAGTITQTSSASGADASSPAILTTLTKDSSMTASGTTVQHIVREGEWLWQIARCYSADPKQAVAANPSVNPRNLKIGSTVTIPSVGTVGDRVVHTPPELCVKLHVVQSGDTWTSIADLYGADPGLTQFSNSNVMLVGRPVKVPLYTRGLNLPLVGGSSGGSNIPPQTTAYTLSVAATPSTYTQVDQIITFNYVITNSGTITIGPAQFTINDSQMNPSAFNCGAADSVLAPGATLVCSNAYKITQNDIDVANLKFTTNASATALPATESVTTILSKGLAQLTLQAAAEPTTYNQVGQEIHFTYLVKNSGATPIGPTQFLILDPFMNPTVLNCGAPDQTLVPDGTVQCSGVYKITEADMSANNIQFSAVASAGGSGAPTSSSVVVTITKQ